MKNPNYKQIEISKINKASDVKKRKCILSGCNEKSIKSHLLQRNGILNNISENGHLIERRLIDANKFTIDESPFEFKKVGLKNALSKNYFAVITILKYSKVLKMEKEILKHIIPIYY